MWYGAQVWLARLGNPAARALVASGSSPPPAATGGAHGRDAEASTPVAIAPGMLGTPQLRSSPRVEMQARSSAGEAILATPTATPTRRCRSRSPRPSHGVVTPTNAMVQGEGVTEPQAAIDAATQMRLQACGSEVRRGRSAVPCAQVACDIRSAHSSVPADVHASGQGEGALDGSVGCDICGACVERHIIDAGMCPTCFRESFGAESLRWLRPSSPSVTPTQRASSEPKVLAIEQLRAAWSALEGVIASIPVEDARALATAINRVALAAALRRSPDVDAVASDSQSQGAEELQSGLFAGGWRGADTLNPGALWARPLGLTSWYAVGTTGAHRSDAMYDAEGADPCGGML